ncbi:hypothetical protein Tco_1303824 [Tanacetum coccineum]
MDEDQAGPDPGESRVALAGPNPKPTHEEFMANVYPNVYESLKFPADEHVILEEPLTTTTTTAATLPPPPQQQSITKSELAARVTALEQKFSSLEQKNKTLAPLYDRFRELPEADMKEILHQRMFETGTYKSLPEHVALYEALEASMARANKDEFLAEKDKLRKRRHDDQDPHPPLPDSDPSNKRRHDSDALVEDVPIPDDVNILDSKDINAAHLPKIKTRPDWLKPANALAKSYKDPEENKLLSKIGDMGSFIKWFCKRFGKKKLIKSNLEDPTFKVVKAFHENSISLQFQMKECHRLLTDQVDLVNPEGHQLVPDVSKLLPLGGTPGQISKLKATNYSDFGLEELVPSLWIESERDYNISATYNITHWWFKSKEFYITRHNAPSDRSKVRSHMRILSVVSLKTLERYGFVLPQADNKNNKISEADFKNLHLNDFEDLYLLHLQGQLNHLSGADKVHLFNVVNLWIRNIIIRKRVEDLQLKIESYQTKLNLTQPDWDASDFLFKEDYTIVSKPRAIIYRDRNNQKKMMRET